MIDDCVRRQDVIQAIYNNKDRLNICEAVRRLEPAYPASYDCISRQGVLDIIHIFFTEEVYKIPTEKTEDGDVLVMSKLQPFLTMNKTLSRRIKELPSVTAKPNIKALGEDMRICRESITDEKVLIGFNMAVALCNKHLGESEDKE